MKKGDPRGHDSIERNVESNRFAKITYLVSILGCSIDQLSTRIGLTNSNLCELNPLTAFLMATGIWLYVDIAAVLMTILVSYLIIEHWSFKYKRFILLFPFTFGFLKLLTGISNIFFYITY